MTACARQSLRYLPFGVKYPSFLKSGTDFAWGMGAQAHISMFGARLEYEGFNIPNISGPKLASLSVFVLVLRIATAIPRDRSIRTSPKT